MGKFHFTPGRSEGQGFFFVGRFRFLFQNLKNTFRTGNSRLEIIVYVGNIHEGPGKLPGIQQKAGNQPYIDPSCSRQDSADYGDNDKIQVIDHVGERHEKA